MSIRLTTEKIISYFDQISSKNLEELTKKNSTYDNNSDNNNDNNNNSDSDSSAEHNINLKNYEEDDIEIFPQSFKDIFERDYDNVIRKGVQHNYINQKTKSNIAVDIVSSFLVILDPDFIDLRPEEQINNVIDFNHHLITSIKSLGLFDKYNYKEFGWSKKDLDEDIKNGVHSQYLLRILVDYFNFNLFIFDIEKEQIYAVYSEAKLNRFKPNIFLSHANDHYEPIQYKKEKFWNYNNPIFEVLLSEWYNQIIALSGSNEKNKKFDLGTKNPINRLKKIIGDTDYHHLKETIINEDNNNEDNNNEDNNNEDNNNEDIVIDDDVFDDMTDIEDDVNNNDDEDEETIKDYSQTNLVQTISYDKKMSAQEIRKIAENAGIDIIKEITKNNKTLYKSKSILISALNNL